MLRLNQHKKARIGINWKLNEQNGEQEVKTGYYAGVKMPLKNGDSVMDFGESNAFRARPIKHPRRQYGTADDNVSVSKNPMYVIDRPGGFAVTDTTNTLCAADTTGPQCCNTKLVPDYRIAIQEPRDCLNKCNSPTRCVNQQTNALKRVRGGALLKNPIQNVGGEDTLVTYYSDARAYLKNRVKMNTTPVNIDGNTGNLCDCSNSNALKATRIFNPSNARFNVQGAVSSDTRIQDLKRQTKSAYNWSQRDVSPFNFCCVNNNLDTVATSNRLGGSDAAPYTEKSKTFIPILGQRTLFKRSTGRKAVCCNN